MTADDLKAALTREPFVPLRFHLVGGKAVSVFARREAWIMPHALFVFRNLRPGTYRADGYDVIALDKIERVEQLVRGDQERATA